MALPNPGMTFTPFDPLPASDLNNLVENIEGLQDWSAFDAASLPITLIDDGSLTAVKSDADATNIGFLEMGRVTLAVAGDTISLTPIPARKYLQILFSLIPTGGTITHGIRFNGDGGANYVVGRNVDGAAISSGVSATSMEPMASKSIPVYTVMYIVNISAQEKLITGHGVVQGAAGAANAIATSEFGGKWVNTASQITRIDCVNGGTGDYAIGSEMVVFGHN